MEPKQTNINEFFRPKVLQETTNLATRIRPAQASPNQKARKPAKITEVINLISDDDENYEPSIKV